MASSASGDAASPYATLQYLHSWAEPHLPPSVNWIIVNGLKGLSSLPPSVANIVPLVIGAFVVYWLVMGAISTVTSTFRQSWFFIKWGTIAVVLAYGWAMMKGEQPMNNSNNAGSNLLSSFLNSNHNPLNNGPFGGIINQAARYAGITNNNNGNAQTSTSPDLNTDELLKSAYNNFVPYPIRMMGNMFGMNPSTTENKRSTRSKSKNQKETEEKLQDTANVATEWLGGVFEKVSEALGDKKDDRWAESRNRRANH